MEIIDIINSYKPSDKMYDGYNSIEEQVDEKISDILDNIIAEILNSNSSSSTKTNLEYLRTLSAEELADWLYNSWLSKQAKCYTNSHNGLIEWLRCKRDE